DFCGKGELITVLQSITVTNGKLEITIPQLPKPGAPTVLNRLVIEKRSKVSPAKWNLGLNHFNVLDQVSYNAGFRTFAVDGDNLVLNGRPFKLRGATLTPNVVRPNDKPLADWFMKTLHSNNISVAKNHACPFNATWFNAADESGVGLSQEGIWVWLMLTDKGIPNDAMLKIWKDEYIALMKKQKNHPSLLWLTHNSEMKLWLSHETRRYEIHSEAVKEFRKVDPTRPVVADTGYSRGYLKTYGLGEKLPGIDDGDIDDTHTFHNWYDEVNFFYLRDGESYFHGTRTPGRPYTSNEFATGYPDADTGHPIKHYIYQHMVPQAQVGKWCFEDRDPKYWLNWLALVNKESHESIRTAYRDTSAGMMLFAMGTWFQNLYDVNTIKAYPTLATVAEALEPVMVSAQLGGRHFYAGSTNTVKSVVVNDSPTYETLDNIRVDWEVNLSGQALSSGTKNYSGKLEYFKNKDEALTFTMPTKLPQPRINAKLVLKLHANGRAISTNTYDIVVADQSFISNAASIRVGYFTQNDRLSPVLTRLGVKPVPVNDLSKLDASTMDVLIVSDLTSKPAGYENILRFAEAGGQVLLSNNQDLPVTLLPNELTGSTDLSKQIVTPCAYEKSIFDGIEPDDMRWFTGTEGWKESPVPGYVPIACRIAYNVNDLPHVTRLAETTKVHGYYHSDKNIFYPKHTFDQVHGYPLVEIQKGSGRIIVSSMCLDAEQDPIAGKLLANLIDYLKE
ncbi:MAG: hypothetical protein FJ220_06025, partial [Kiritimatiellaceae bacterium]|nr:hypothetical protein [Kiritimatiellaceae bacterium]